MKMRTNSYIYHIPQPGEKHITQNQGKYTTSTKQYVSWCNSTANNYPLYLNHSHQHIFIYSIFISNKTPNKLLLLKNYQLFHSLKHKPEILVLL